VVLQISQFRLPCFNPNREELNRLLSEVDYSYFPLTNDRITMSAIGIVDTFRFFDVS